MKWFKYVNYLKNKNEKKYKSRNKKYIYILNNLKI